MWLTRGPKGPITCTWVQCATFLTDWPGWPFLYTNQPEKHKLGRGCWDLASGQVSLNSVQQYERKSWKCLSQSEVRAVILFSDQPEKHKLGRGRWDLASCQVSLNFIQSFQRRSRKCLSQSEARRPSCFFDRPEKHKLGRGRWYFASWQVLLNCVQQFQRKSRKCLSQSEARGPILFFWLARKTNLVADVEILLPVKFRWIPFSGFRGEVKNVSANQRSERPSCFSDRPEKHKLSRRRWDIASCQVLLNSVQRFQRSRKCLS